MVVDIFDNEESLRDFLPFLRRAVKAGTVIWSDVEAEQILPEEGTE